MGAWTNHADTDANTDNIATTADQPRRDIHVTIGHKSRPLRDGGENPAQGDATPSNAFTPYALWDRRSRRAQWQALQNCNLTYSTPRNNSRRASRESSHIHNT